MHGKPRVYGHRHGVKSVREVTEAAAEIGIEWLTLYAFSTENWRRPPREINALMTLLVETLRNEINTLNDNNIRLCAIGDLDRLPSKTHQALLQGMENTAGNTRMTLTLALNYSSRWEMAEAMRSIANDVASGKIDPKNIDEAMISSHLSTAKMPDPELMIRTSGERRISNYLLWQLAYAELYFTPVHWPDFRKEHFFEALIDFQKRERRFGKTGEQAKASAGQTTD